MPIDKASNKNMDEEKELNVLENAGDVLYRQYLEMAQSGKSPLQCGILMLLGVQQQKARELDRGVPLDSSWQSSIAWLISQLGERPDAIPIVRSVVAAMAGTFDPKVNACRMKILELGAQMRAHPMHQRDQLLVRSATLDELETIYEDPGCFAVVINPSSPVQLERASGFSYKPGMAGVMLRKQKITPQSFWPAKKSVTKLFTSLRERVRSNQDIAEVTFVHDRQPGIALALAKTLATCWNVPCVDEGDVDILMLGTARQAMAEEVLNYQRTTQSTQSRLQA